LKPIEIEEPKINRQTDNGEEGRSNEERTGHPVDPIPGGGKHGQMSIFRWALAREHDVFFRPVMDLPTMRTGQPWTIQLRAVPGCFLNGAAGGREFGGGGTAHEDPFNNGTIRRF